MKLEGKSVVLTGASSGMGRYMAGVFANEGANLVVIARRGELLDTLAEELKDAPGTVIPFAGDVRKEEDCEAAIDLAVEKVGKLDILINNAGVMDDLSPIGELKDEVMTTVFETNVYGPLYTMRKAVKVFLEQKNGGNIINIASLGAIHQTAGVTYAASKAAVIAMTKNTAFMYMPDKIRCNAIAPGRIDTGIMTMGGLPNLPGYLRAKHIFALGPEAGQSEHIAAAALFLASDDSAYVNGDVLVVD
ncbi:MAG: SDR family oxidoreductase, partial [Atopobiaceae bacterium]|nr:SDR family oxidoreductase [Atopobiaceae bacterium]